MGKKRRQLTESFKAKVALEAVRETKTLSEFEVGPEFGQREPFYKMASSVLLCYMNCVMGRRNEARHLHRRFLFLLFLLHATAYGRRKNANGGSTSAWRTFALSAARGAGGAVFF